MHPIQVQEGGTQYMFDTTLLLIHTHTHTHTHTHAHAHAHTTQSYQKSIVGLYVTDTLLSRVFPTLEVTICFLHNTNSIFL